MNKKLMVALGVLFLVNILNFYDRHVPGALAEPVKIEFDLTDTQLGWLGSAFIWLYALVGVPLGRMSDRLSRKGILAAGIAVWASLTAMNALAANYTHLLLARLGVAVGEAVVAPAATSWIGDLFPAMQRARALAIFMLGVPIGGALSYFLSGPVAQAYGWRAAMVIAAVPAIVLLPAILLLPEPTRGAAEENAHARNSGAAKASMWSVLKIPTLLWIIASGALLNFNMYAYGNFLVSFFIRIHGQTLAQAGIITGIVYAVGGLAGGLIAGNLGDRIVKTRKNGRMFLAAVIAMIGAPVAYFAIIQPRGSLMLAIVLMAFAYGACNTYYGLVYSSIQDIVPPSLRASTMSIYFMFMYMCGASMGPLLTGQLSDARAKQLALEAGSQVVTAAHRAGGLQQAMLIMPVLSVALGLVLWAGSRTIARDIERRNELAQRAAAAAPATAVA